MNLLTETALMSVVQLACIFFISAKYYMERKELLKIINEIADILDED